MGKTNYNAMSNPVAETENENVITNEEIITENEEVEVSEEVVMPDTVTGTISNCVKLNIRENADINSKVLCVIPSGSEVTIHTESLTDEWLMIVTADGIEGFCMSQYVTINQ